MAAIGKKIFVYGGAVWSPVHRWQKHSNEMYIFDTETLHWSLPVTKGPQPNVSTFCMLVVIGPLVWVVGGGSKHKPVVLSEIRVLDTINWTWSANKFVPKDLKSQEVINELHSRNLDYRNGKDSDLVKRLEIAIQNESNFLEIAGPSLSPRGCLAGGLFDNQIFFFGGFCGAPLNDIKVLDLGWKRRLESCGIHFD